VRVALQAEAEQAGDAEADLEPAVERLRSGTPTFSARRRPSTTFHAVAALTGVVAVALPLMGMAG
jgi:hypothetical protein